MRVNNFSILVPGGRETVEGDRIYAEVAPHTPVRVKVVSHLYKVCHLTVRTPVGVTEIEKFNQHNAAEFPAAYGRVECTFRSEGSDGEAKETTFGLYIREAEDLALANLRREAPLICLPV